MSATVQATCPGCRNVLRIPVDWAEKALKCKKCGAVVQARRRTADTAPAAALPTAVPVVAEPYYPPAAYPQESVFATDPESPTTRKYRRRGGNRFATLAVFVALAGGLAAAGFVFKDRITQALQDRQAGPVTPADEPKPGTGKATPTKLSDPFPRRLLFVHLSKYVYFNTLAAGKDARKRDMPTQSAERMQFELRVPKDKDNNQLVTLIDTATGPDFRPPLKATLTHAYTDFFATSRDQDRIVVYFGGHAVEAGGKAYLVPIEGEPDAPDTLVPLDDFYARLKACKAQQKVVLFDVCRFNPGFGAAKPGSEPMSPKLAELLHAAPPGVQVMTSCAAGENAAESELGSEFLTAFRAVAAGAAKGGRPAPTPDDPVSAEAWAAALRAELAKPRDGVAAQTPKLAGGEGPRVAYNREEPPARRVEWPAAAKGAAADQVNKLLELAALPGIRKELDIPAGLGEVYPFPADALKAYASDGVSDDEVRKNPDKYPVRKATLDALTFLRKNWVNGGGDGLRESIEGTADDRVKKAVVKEQEQQAKLTLGVSEQMAALEAAEAELKGEKSPRWQALFQYTLAQARMRWAYLEEYNLSLGNIRTDSLAKPTGGGMPVWRLVSVGKMKSKKDVKDKADAAKEGLEKLAADHKGTPWEVLAKMHTHVALGLEWKLVESKKDDAKDDPPKK